MNNENSYRLFLEAQHYLPGGVNSPVRAFKAVGGSPLFIERGSGCRLFDEDGNEFIDYVCSWGPMILGHAHPAVTAALRNAVECGTSFGAPTHLETVLARLVCAAMPSVERVRFVNSGTEAAMSALRLARAFTGCDLVIKFEGCYHGHSDGLLARAGSGLATLGIPDCPGVPESFARHTLTARYNDLESVRELFNQHPAGIAAVIVEPVAANMGVVPPKPGFLEGLRELTAGHGSLLVFDEVITGFRLAYGGAQSIYGVKPDMTCLGKIIGGGLPVGAYGGRRDIMEMVAPLGPVYQAGTLSGNPLAMTAGVEVLRALGQPGIYDELESASALLEKGLAEAVEVAGISVRISRVGSLLTAFFTDRDVSDWESARTSDLERFRIFHQTMLGAGIYWPPSQFEAAFVSTVHGQADIEFTVKVFEDALTAVGLSG